MFTVNFYTISKRRNSTALPSGSATVFNCTAKDPLSIHNPSLMIRLASGAAGNPVSFNYCYISDFGRYYWITDWVNDGPNWTCSCVVDVLASFRTGIGNSTVYVTRSSAAFNTYLPDGVYPISSEENSVKYTLPSLFYNNPLGSSGFYSVGIASKDSVKYYLLNPTELANLMAYLFSDTYYSAALNSLGIATLYPEAKIAVDPMQYIVSCYYCPAPLAAAGTAFAFHKQGTAGYVNVGLVQTTMINQAIADTRSTDTTYLDIPYTSLPAGFWHPQAANRGAYLKAEPYSSYVMYLPPFGIVSLPAMEIANASALRINYIIDYKTCGGVVDIIKDPGTTDELIIAHLCGSFGVEMPLSRIMTRGRNFYNEVRDIAGGAAAVAAGIISGNASGIISGIGAIAGAGVRETVEANKPYATIYAGAGDSSQLTGTPYFGVTHKIIADESNSTIGRPLMSLRQISTIAGFIQGDPSGLAISGATADELQEIMNYIAGGMFYA